MLLNYTQPIILAILSYALRFYERKFIRHFIGIMLFEIKYTIL